ncbi:MAG: thiamine diphosphokinase [Solobacterium sp.]|nr:thiamine diphosphokinase [Solobacterium sp.]
MSDTVIAALKLTKRLPAYDADLAGADAGALFLAENGLRMKLAIGDFDSVRKEDLERIRACADEMIVLNPIKDDSDSEAIITCLLERGYRRIILTGGTGGRIDHEYVNLKLTEKYPGTVYLEDEKNRIWTAAEGRHPIRKDHFAYISFFTSSEACISLEGFRYPLDRRVITADDLYTLSNEICGEEGVLHVHSGSVLVMQCRDS